MPRGTWNGLLGTTLLSSTTSCCDFLSQDPGAILQCPPSTKHMQWGCWVNSQEYYLNTPQPLPFSEGVSTALSILPLQHHLLTSSFHIKKTLMDGAFQSHETFSAISSENLLQSSTLLKLGFLTPTYSTSRVLLQGDSCGLCGWYWSLEALRETDMIGSYWILSYLQVRYEPWQ